VSRLLVVVYAEGPWRPGGVRPKRIHDRSVECKTRAQCQIVADREMKDIALDGHVAKAKVTIIRTVPPDHPRGRTYFDKLARYEYASKDGLWWLTESKTDRSREGQGELAARYENNRRSG
jgi:hypothetical protein